MGMGRIDPKDIPELPVAFMNEDHQRELTLVNDLEEALAAHAAGGEGTFDAVLAKLALLAVHTRDHFMREEAAMREARFPAYPVHKVEHDRVLAEMDREARLFREKGDGKRLSRYLFEALPSWFRGHVRTMDVVTAAFLADRQADAGPAGFF
jgi:hemerythrin